MADLDAIRARLDKYKYRPEQWWAREDIAALLAEVDALRAALERVTGLFYGSYTSVESHEALEQARAALEGAEEP